MFSSRGTRCPEDAIARAAAKVALVRTIREVAGSVTWSFYVLRSSTGNKVTIAPHEVFDGCVRDCMLGAAAAWAAMNGRGFLIGTTVRM